jgi:CheY-like chemotaxis protein
VTGESILVVEDEGLIALHLTEMLERAGFRVIGPVNSGELALRTLGGSLPDLVLMDIKLAGAMDGIETARQIRERLPVPLIFLTAYSSDRTRERIQGLTPDAYLTKPVEEKDLLVAISDALAGQAGKKQ